MSGRIVWKNGRPMTLATAHFIDEIVREAEIATRKPKRVKKMSKRKSTEETK